MGHTLTRHMERRHLSATRGLGYGLVLADHAGWFAASVIWQIHLKPSELAALAITSLKAMDNDTYAEVISFMEDNA